MQSSKREPSIRHGGNLTFAKGALLSLSLVWIGAQVAQAETLGRVLGTLQNDREYIVRCFQAAIEGLVPGDRVSGGCTSIVSRLYLDVLRHQEEQILIGKAIAQQRELRDLVQGLVSSGRLPSGDLLLAEVELKRWQLKEAEISAALHHAVLFFEQLQADPKTFVPPQVRSDAWPESKDSALAALASAADSPEGARLTSQRRLQQAWVDYEAARRARALLRPTSAFAADLADATQQQFDIGVAGLATLQNRRRDAETLKLDLLSAEFDLLAAQIAILEILERTSAIE